MKQILLVKLDAADIPRAGEWIEQACIKFGLNKTAAFEVKTCVVEAINNCIEHAYEGQAGNVTISAWEQDDRICIQVEDEGRMPESKDLPSDHAELPDPFSERGRGLAIMRAWMDELSVVREGSSNILRMSKRIL